MKEENKMRLKNDWIIILITTIVSILSNYGFNNYLNNGVAFNPLEIKFWTTILFPLSIISVITILITYGIIFGVDKVLNNQKNDYSSLSV